MLVTSIFFIFLNVFKRPFPRIFNSEDCVLKFQYDPPFAKRGDDLFATIIDTCQLVQSDTG